MPLEVYRTIRFMVRECVCLLLLLSNNKSLLDLTLTAPNYYYIKYKIAAKTFQKLSTS